MPGARSNGRAVCRKARAGLVAGLTAAALVVAAACDSPTIPGREAPYDFRLDDFLSDASWVLRWEKGKTIRVHVVGGEAGEAARLLEDAFRAGAEQWNRAMLFGEFRLAEAARVEDADVVLMWSNVQPPVDTRACPASLDGSRAVTAFCLSDHGSQPVCSAPTRRLCPYPLLPVGTGMSQVKMVVVVSATMAAEPERLKRLVAHELGHVIGIATHSPDRSDIMFAGVEADTLSVADRATAQVLYHTPADIVP
ncbi:MAG TPA: hypothetical protein VKZ58_05725 [Longimicrobiales bacterium]|nr:hypothetical protein [Longimicrobiales bacterium]